ncbi:lipase family protein [Antrihabitans stalactiti]|uniref:Lipase n=1 Tax=Antrihabitans stalactiti TaxID=2584121 RepID=A0A848KE83_9NOCA|nr:lipase family protein [Antrihabitans stalactiti]NMN96531.1 lipase [Antrihabitans stalactiti]
MGRLTDLCTRSSIAAAIAAIVVVGGLSGARADAAPIYPIPDPDPFYAAPADIGAKAPGDVLEVRPMPNLLFFPGTSITQVKFRSTNSEGNPIAATTLLMLPDRRGPNPPLLSYQHIINGLSPQCAPSRVLYSSDPDLVVKEAPALNVALQKGWAVALPDHLGPTAAYGAAKLGGMITLDAIRAITHVPALGLQNSPIGMAGYSGGGMATAWAAALAPTYAPELNIAGVAAGGVPMNLTKMARVLGDQPHPVFGLALAAAIGLEREYPDRFPISAQMNARGLAIRDAMANGCTNAILFNGAGHSVPELAASMSLASNPKAWEVGDENSLELFAGVPKAPIFEWHAPSDALIPVDSIINTINRYCASGATVESELFPSPDHLTTAVLGTPTAMNYLDDRFRGVPAPSNCPR